MVGSNMAPERINILQGFQAIREMWEDEYKM